MFGVKKQKGLRLRTSLILTYSFVALLAVAAAGAVALPLLQRYQADRAEKERQRLVLEQSDRLNTLRSQLQNTNPNINPLHDFLYTVASPVPTGAKATKTWPPTPSIEVVRQRFSEIAQNRTMRILVLTTSDREVKVDTEPDQNQSLEGETLVGAGPPATTPTPTVAPGAAPPAPASNAPNDMMVVASNGKPYNVIYRAGISQENSPNLFGLNNKGLPISYLLLAVVPSVPVPDVWRDLALTLWLAVLVALGVALIAAVLLARFLSRPVVRLTEATQSVARGDYDQQVLPQGSYELNRLAQSFNQMTLAVAESQRMQRELIANVSHELKTPLTSIQGFSQAMLDGALRRPEDFARSAEIISSETARMIRLVNSLLDLTRLESGQAALNCREMDLAEMLRSCVDSFAPLAEAGEVTLLVEFTPPLLVWGDADRLRQVFNNLIDNALKYTSPCGRVRVRAYRNGSTILAMVSDSGAGIPAVDLAHIFERFYQADKSRRRDLAQGGIGLGLAITKEIVLAHGGKIDATSQEGQGSQFTVVLPALSTRATPDRAEKSAPGSPPATPKELVRKN